MYTYQITATPLSEDPGISVVTANIMDDSGNIVVNGRNYSLPATPTPKPADFAKLIQVDVDGLSAAQAAQASLAQTLTSQSTVPVDNDAVNQSVTPTVDSSSQDGQ